jgi:hypothetical protein
MRLKAGEGYSPEERRPPTAASGRGLDCRDFEKKRQIFYSASNFAASIAK